MAKQDYSEYQHTVIERYYSNLDIIMLHKIGELVSELYVAETDAKRNKLWQRVEKAMTQLKVPTAIAEHIMQKRDVQILAKNLQDWLSLAGKRPAKKDT
jgi:molybdopterin synthase catalytic subunit